ncbi:MAG: DUF262 domain-containing protein [Nitrospirae bacterium]|nr:DUF262 domain-containing protein [Nitrospirota bacterium]MBF0520658.1 DUF262 domain-containing protein [Nitrospirota bacterium]MBF0534138.1 DUF262 domain-containing protein [Nitrospirota bacterium]MBF0617025.1 DUF262 domain-containing protein [Nitrospirota bacterium]
MKDDDNDRLIADDGSTGIECEDTGDTHKAEPYNPAKVRVSTKPTILAAIRDRLMHNEIDLKPGFQREFVWNETAQSRLIESMMIKIPIPAFYMDATDEDRWLVVDGLQRLSTIKRFVIDKDLKLTKLEFLKEHEKKTFDELPHNFQRRINETEFTVFLIEKGTPGNVKFNIFKRINTGGEPLSPQEIRHALNQGKPADVLAEMAKYEEFKKATNKSIKEKRMADRECVLRFISFYRNYPESYVFKDFESFDYFLNQCMSEIKTLDDDVITDIREKFKKVMDVASEIFGKDAFRKRYDLKHGLNPINKALFETWSVNLARLNDNELDQIKSRAQQLKEIFMKKMNKAEFGNLFASGTGDPTRIKDRFKEIDDIIKEVIK